MPFPPDLHRPVRTVKKDGRFGWARGRWWLLSALLAGCSAAPIPDVLPPSVLAPPPAPAASIPVPPPVLTHAPSADAARLCDASAPSLAPGVPTLPGRWEIATICRDGRAVALDPSLAPADIQATRFGDDGLGLSGASACNGFHASARLRADGTFTSDGVSTTFMECAEPRASVENALYRVLSRAGTTATDGERFWRLEQASETTASGKSAVVLRRTTDLAEHADCVGGGVRSRVTNAPLALSDTARVVLDNCSSQDLTYAPCGAPDGLYPFTALRRWDGAKWVVAEANACSFSGDALALPAGRRLRFRAVVRARELPAGTEPTGRYRFQWGIAMSQRTGRAVGIDSEPFIVGAAR